MVDMEICPAAETGKPPQTDAGGRAKRSRSIGVLGFAYRNYVSKLPVDPVRLNQSR
jgi:hypothetical protein